MRRLAETLEDVAGQAKLYDVTSAAVRGANRRRRTRTFTASALTILVVTCVLLNVAMFLQLNNGGTGRPDLGPGRQNGEPPALVKALLDSPTRGSLAGDINLQKDVLDRIIADPDAYGLPGDRAKLRVLFAGDIPGNRRLVIVAGATGAPQLVNLTGGKGAAAKSLKLTGWSDVDTPVVRDDWRGNRGDEGFVVMFGPAGYDLSVSDSPRYLADGTIKREWKAEPAGYVARDTKAVPNGLRVRISRDTTVLYEGAVFPPGTARRGAVDVNPLHGRGKPAPRAAEYAADALAYNTGLTGPDIRYVVLWSDDFWVEDPNKVGTGMGQIATVMALTPDGGGPYLTLTTDASPEPNSRTHPNAAGVIGDPEKALLVMRLPHFTQDPLDTLQIVAPPAAVRAEFVRQGDGAVLATTPLTNGVGRIELPAPVEGTVRAFDAKGAVVAERAYTDAFTYGDFSNVEPQVRGW
ncbi:hypothetical protein ACFO1B_20940 [Dactylosporangium siamense]|uniref:Uncharacterized protein n=1 Tax=Dactylosporangium siamense TaxID=685454 RepID=A0A919PL44_9ACTN|nr:hypothetical protein [Dactylosporangium siamense]GIG46800.1 hypothetical protein Dsi01nite_048410 [Dactylosporangium siamense]